MLTCVAALISLTSIMGASSCDSKDDDASTGGPTSVQDETPAVLEVRVRDINCRKDEPDDRVTFIIPDYEAGATLNITVYRPYEKEGGAIVKTDKVKVKSDGTAVWHYECQNEPTGRYEAKFADLGSGVSGSEFFDVMVASKD